MVFKLKLILVTFTVLGLVQFPQPVMAFFSVTNPPPEPKVLVSKGFKSAALVNEFEKKYRSPSGTSPYFVEIGQPDSLKITSKATGMPMDMALKMNLPKNWKVTKQSFKNLLEEEISWHSVDQPLRSFLVMIGEEKQARFFVNWHAKEITVLPVRASTLSTDEKKSEPVIKVAEKSTFSTRPGKPSSEKSEPTTQAIPAKIKPVEPKEKTETKPPVKTQKVLIPVAEKAKKDETAKVAAVVNPVKKEVVTNVTADKKPEPPIKTPPPSAPRAIGVEKAIKPNPKTLEVKNLVWRVKGGSFRKQLEKWCDINSWALAWNASLWDYDIPEKITGTFRGDFVTTVEDTFEALRKTAKINVTIDFYDDGYDTDKIVVIEDRK